MMIELFAILLLLDVDLGPQREPAAAALVAFDDPVSPADDSAGREIRPRHDLQQLGQMRNPDCR